VIRYAIIALLATVVMAAEPVPDSVDTSFKDTVSTITPTVSEQEILGKVRTVYDVEGRPINQSQEAKGYHRVAGKATLKNGVDTVTINTSTADGRQDMSFLGDSTYSGMAWSLDAGNGNRYWIVPIGGNKFVVMSSDTTDNATVRFQVEGE